ncbi:MAG: extensin [Rhizobium sp.]|nr:MAG: extensin [Rhizobium sp.]
MLHRLCLLVTTLALISASEPPAQVPVPQPKPGEGQSSTPSEKPSDETPQRPAEAPKPVPKPQPEEKPVAKPDASGNQQSDGEKTPADKGSDDSKKEGEDKDGVEQKKPTVETAKPDEKPPEPVKPEDPAALQACGAEFEPLEPVRDEEQGCGIESPVELSVILPGIKLEPSGTMRCETALALSRWTKEMMVPATALAFPDRKVTTIANASTYICRNRNSAENGKISEHAKGKPRGEDGTPEGAFQRTITAAACLFFRTVLSPGSDATHQDHLHLDVLERKGGYLYCR